MNQNKVLGKRGPTDRGAAAVEFALVLPLLLILVFGIIDFGRAFNAQITLTQAAREGARMTALGYSSGTVQSKTAAAATGLGLTASAVTVTSCPAGATQSTEAVVTVRYTLSFSNPMIGLVGLPSTKTLTGTGHMPCQG
jgi:Flp pilus assembly protein TadG